MSYGAPYRLDLAASDDGTTVLPFGLAFTNGMVFPLDQFSIEFSMQPVDGWCGLVALNQTSGITVDLASQYVFVALTPTRAGQYRYGLRGVQQGTNYAMFCEGTLTVGDGSFRGPGWFSGWLCDDYDRGCY